jgi:hypothetical protein
MPIAEYVGCRGNRWAAFQNLIAPRVYSAPATTPLFVPDHVHQNRKQPRSSVCAWCEPVEDLPGTQARLLYSILGGTSISQNIKGLAVEGSQIG